MADYDPDADLAQLDAAFAKGLDRADRESWTVLFDGYLDPTLEMIPHASRRGGRRAPPGPWSRLEGTWLAKTTWPTQRWLATMYSRDESRTPSGRSSGQARPDPSSGGEEAPPAEAASVAPIVASELMRSAELLISVSAVGLDLEGPSRWEATPQAPHGIVATRREILGHVLADLADPRIEVGERHFSLGPYRIHLATGIATKAGQAVEIEAQPGHGLWAPPDPLLNRIVAIVAALSRTA